tara:strand:- start:23926 stop:24405 length:480 start_codon:yes stop_codon:yes gene_type:complete
MISESDIIKLEEQYNAQNYGALLIYDNSIEKNNFIENLVTKILNKHNLIINNPGCIVNCFMANGLPIGAHDFMEHRDKNIYNHWIYFATRSKIINGGEMMTQLLGDSLNLDVFSPDLELKTTQIKNGLFLKTKNTQTRFFNCIECCSHPVFHFNIFSYE